MLFHACYNPIDDIDGFFGFSIKDGVILVKEAREEYGGINSDGSYIYVYYITDSSIISHAKEKFYPYKNAGRDANTIEEIYLINTAGYYQTITSEQEVKSLYIDTISNNLIFSDILL